MTFMGDTTPIDPQADETLLVALLAVVIFVLLATSIFYGIAWLRNPGYFKSEAFQRRRDEPATLKTPLDVWNHR